VPDDRLVVFKGSGSNGKTTIVDAIREALGNDYAVTMPDRVLLARQGDHPTELMTLRGARLGFMEELPELGHLNAKRLKDLLGTGEMTARYIAKDTVSWKPTHTPVVTTNYLPRVDESDDGTWRRLVLLDFPYRYRRPGVELLNPYDRNGDPRLRERLRAGRGGQHEAILAWLIDGAVQWYQFDRRMPEDPPSVLQATAVWRKNSDVLSRYADERLVFDPQVQVVATELFEDFNDWLQANGHRPWSDQSFSARFAQHGEAIANEVAKKRSRRSPTLRLSRRPRGFRATGATPGSPVPPQFTAWVGIRFQTPDDMDDADDQA
jgi:P4 family phage/plasmid primase-like protien